MSIGRETIILKCDGKSRHSAEGSTLERLALVVCSMVSDWSGGSLVACCADPCSCAVDRPADHGGAHAAPLASVDSRHALSRAIRIRFARRNLARFPTCRDCRGRRALLRASWIRLAGDADRCGRRYGRRTHPRWVHAYAATCQKLILRNRPLDSAQGRGVHTCSGGGIGAWQAAYPGTLSERGGMGSWSLWCGAREPLLLQNFGSQYRSGTRGATRRNSAAAAEAAAGSHESL